MWKAGKCHLSICAISVVLLYVHIIVCVCMLFVILDLYINSAFVLHVLFSLERFHLKHLQYGHYLKSYFFCSTHSEESFYSSWTYFKLNHENIDSLCLYSLVTALPFIYWCSGNCITAQRSRNRSCPMQSLVQLHSVVPSDPQSVSCFWPRGKSSLQSLQRYECVLVLNIVIQNI